MNFKPVEFDEQRHWIRGFLRFRKKHEKFDVTPLEPVRAVWLEFYQGGGEFKIDDVLLVCKQRNLNEKDSFAFINHIAAVFFAMGLLKMNRFGKINVIQDDRKGGSMIRDNESWLNWILNGEQYTPAAPERRKENNDPIRRLESARKNAEYQRAYQREYYKKKKALKEAGHSLVVCSVGVEPK